LISETSNSESDEKICTPEKTQFKAIREKTVNGDKVYTIVDLDDDKDPDRSLAESAENIGFLETVKVMSDGTIIDGFHRLAANPNWPKEVVPTVTNDKERLFYVLGKHGHRRPFLAEEQRQIASELAYKHGVTFEEYKKNTGFGHTTCSKYFPKELQHLNPVRAQAGIASGKARALEAELAKIRMETQPKNDFGLFTKPLASNDANGVAQGKTAKKTAKKEPELISDKFVPTVEQNPTQEPTSEEKIAALIAENNEEQQTLEKLISDAKADLPDDFKRAVYNLAVDPAKELTQKRLNECLTVAVEVLFDFIERAGTTQDLLQTAKERW
jgi:hypothetical protein